MAKLRGDGVQRVLDNHSENIRSVALAHKDASERDRSRAPQEFRQEVFTGVWKFSEARERIKKEINELAEFYINDIPRPPDLRLRVERIAVAMFVLDKLDDLRKAAVKKPSTTLVSLFEVARASAEQLLGEKFLKMSRDDVIHAYLDAKPSLVSLATCCNVHLPELHEAVSKYRLKVTAEIDSVVDAAFDAA